MPISVESLIAEASQLDAAAIEAGVAGAEAALKTKRASKGAAVSLLDERRERRDRWATKAQTLRTESAAEQATEATRLLKNTSKANLTGAADAIGAAANVQAVISNVLAQAEEAIRDAIAADKAAAIALKMAEVNYFKSAGLQAAAQAAIAWAPLLTLEPNSQISLEGSRVEAFAKSVLETEIELQQLIAERNSQ
jgi:hypothetical protein